MAMREQKAGYGSTATERRSCVDSSRTTRSRMSSRSRLGDSGSLRAEATLRRRIGYRAGKWCPPVIAVAAMSTSSGRVRKGLR
ncbi:hypothetical protein B296_00032467 [Ensete ventricosum]|uniref:Uncharacterized protein n=1 Tax=Ensete ventricosum TaxID=4639 RepID=A0A426XWT1_ENSVE|nr:hypothetical protein B296_00032467 [Ensete ventricosum]